MSPQAQEALSPKQDESVAMTVGRIASDVASMAQGVGEVGAGGGGIAGGGVLCATGVGCLVGAPAIIVSGALVAHGAGTAVNGALHGGNDLGNLITMAKSHTTLEDAQRETGKWKIDTNFDHSTESDLEAVQRERTGYQYPGWARDGHTIEVQGARRGLLKIADYITNALRDTSWSPEAREYFYQQQAEIQQQLDKINNALTGPLP